ncbi:ATP-binding protein [Streptomyces sp. bgisy022]|uniref:ATP-binding protein n=1 Tax=Streptomyces sp. bgisy022 TaxID=3413769 RepID=UPI003D754C4C
MLTGTTDGVERRALTVQLPSTVRGARTARGLAVRRLEEWGHPPESDASGAIALVVAELATNAVRHGSVPGREFGLRVEYDGTSGLVRIEVSDAATAKRPPETAPSSCPDGESGRGLLLVDALSRRWGWTPRETVGKTVWAEVPVGPPGGSGGRSGTPGAGAVP